MASKNGYLRIISIISKAAFLCIPRLHRKSYWGGKHASVELIVRLFPGHLRGTVAKEIKEMIKESLIIAKPTFYGLQISLNPRAKAEIERALENFKK